MPVLPTTRFLDPAVLAEVSNLDLVAKTVVDGFIAGLHRSPDFGFSQEFAEYRAYSPGDDLRHVDWNVYARTDKAYLKRYRGETNTQLTILLDASASMDFASGRVSKFDYARYLTAAIAYLANLQRDSTGLIIFQDEIANFVRPSARHGQLMRLLHAIDTAQTGSRTDYARPFVELQQFTRRRGITVLVSDFLSPVETVIDAVVPLRVSGNEVILFQILDPRELEPKLDEPALLIDMETAETMEVTPEYARSEYKAKLGAHLEKLRSEAERNGMEYFLLRTDRPLDTALKEYLTIRQRRF